MTDNTVILGVPGSGKSFLPFGREQLYAAGRPKASDVPEEAPADDPDIMPDDPSIPAEDPDELPEAEDEPEAADYTPPPAPKSILELGGGNG